METTPWMGRDEGPGAIHTRWHHMVYAGKIQKEDEAKGLAIFGFASHEGTIRNQGRPGAAKGPFHIRHALAQLAFHGGQIVHDRGDVTVDGHNMEEAQAKAGEQLGRLIPEHSLTVVLGGGHETTYAAYQGLVSSGSLDEVKKWGVISLDSHFAIRNTPQPTAVTALRQIITDEKKSEREFRYSVLGVSEADNVRAQFEHAQDLNVSYLKDDQCAECRMQNVLDFVDQQLADLDLVYLSVDLDVLPGYQAPGVSAPSALGVPMIVVQEVVRRVAASGKMAMMDVVGLNPEYDLDERTARAAARLIDGSTRAAFNRPAADAADSPEQREFLAQRQRALHAQGLS
ncbi:formimidoylglutamase [Rothia uropygialis]|uniref:formimidoylglutamase n=1 Tax=Kocuria sp. 36 TaxID=1415402 RepID=UPI00101C80E9|nr:formimidoylglutamase [Kocuria sp. 36]